MPTYQYACTSCGEDLEVVQKFTDDALTECPACGGKLRKVYSPVGVVFKGSGFYRTDSRDAKKSGAGAASGSGSSSSNGNGNGSSSSNGGGGKAKESSSSDSSSSSASSGDSSKSAATTSSSASNTAA
ncbi:FmdB family zinc ribbon protein [Flindersiella endophytica]